MFQFRKYIGSKRGSLVLSLVASGTVAATIVATHQVAQRFASGAVGAFNQQQAFILAQRSLAVAGLMVNKNIVICSNTPVSPGSDRVRGCNRVGPLASDSKANQFYHSLGLRDSWFSVVPAEIDAYGVEYLTFEHPSGSHFFKDAKITWALRSLKDTNLRSISGPLSKGYMCRDVNTFNVIENAYCPPMDKRSGKEKLLNRDTSLISDENKKCRTKDTDSDGRIDENDDINDTDNANTVCDYYSESDGDSAIVFISVRVPYQSTDAEEEEEKHLVVNAAIRRPIAIVKTYMDANSSVCPISCAIASRPHMENSNDSVDNFDCVGFISGTQSGGKYFQDNIYSVSTSMKVKNYGPGVLYDLHLLKEDVDLRTGLLLGKSMVGFSNSPLEPSHLTLQDGEKDISHTTPCYSSSFYSPSLTRITCDCDPANSLDAVNTARGVICVKDKSVCAGTGNRIFASSAPAVLEGSEARDSLSGCLHSPGATPNLPALSNSILTVFEALCEDSDNCEQSSYSGENAFTRIPSDQVSTPRKTWCGNNYVTSTATGRKGRPTAQVNTDAHVVQETVFPMANQDNIPLSAPQP